MKKFETPSKTNSTINGVSGGLREGDWVCMSCNNLNFSFRKKCNRCKLQTKEQNESIHAYYYPLAFEYPTLSDEVLNSKSFLSETSSLSRSSSSSEGEEVQSPTLPSKNYNINEEGNERLSLACGSLDWDLFLKESEDDFSLSESSTENEEADYLDLQLEEMVTKIII